MPDDVAVLICSSDSRRDVLEHVLPSISRFWPDCPYPVYVGVNSPCTLAAEVLPVIAPASEWYQESLVQLRQIDARHLIVVLDDFLFGAPVNQQRLAELVDTARSQRLPYLRLVPLGRSLRERLSRRRYGPGIERIDIRHPFYSALQIAIWSKDHLLAMLQKRCSIWEFERARIVSATHYAVIDSPPIVYRHVVEKGRWLPDAAALFRSAGVVFRAGDRAVWSRWRYLLLLRDSVKWVLVGHSTC
jgi:hypothetical protein